MRGGSCTSYRIFQISIVATFKSKIVLFSHEIMVVVANLFIYLFIIFIFCFLLRNLKSLIWNEGGLRIPEGKTVQRVKSVYSRVISKRREHHTFHKIHLKVY